MALASLRNRKPVVPSSAAVFNPLRCTKHHLNSTSLSLQNAQSIISKPFSSGKQSAQAKPPKPKQQSKQTNSETSIQADASQTAGKPAVHKNKAIAYRDYMPWTQQADYIERMGENAPLNAMTRVRTQLSGMEDIFSVRDIEAAAVEAVKLAFGFTNQLARLPRPIKDALLADSTEDVVEVTLPRKKGAGEKPVTIKINRQGGVKRRIVYVLEDTQQNVKETLLSLGPALGVTVKVITQHEDCTSVPDSEVEQSCAFFLKYPPLGYYPNGELPKPIRSLVDRMRDRGAMVVYSLPSTETLTYQGYDDWIPPPDASIVIGSNTKGALWGRKFGFLGTSAAQLVEALSWGQSTVPKRKRQPQQQPQQEQDKLPQDGLSPPSLASTLASLSSASTSSPTNTAALLKKASSTSLASATTTSFSYSAKVKPKPLHVTLKQLMSAHAHIGLHVAKWNPKMDTYLLGQKDNIHIFDLSKTQLLLRRALGFISFVVKEGGRVALVSDSFESYPEFADYGFKNGHYFMKHWKCGMLTNFPYYTKKIATLVDPTYAKNITLPSAVVLLTNDAKSLPVLRECRSLMIPVVALCDTDIDPRNIDYPIPTSVGSIQQGYLYTKLFVEALERGKEDAVLQQELEAQEAEEIEEKTEKMGRASYILESLGMAAKAPITGPADLPLTF